MSLNPSTTNYAKGSPKDSKFEISNVDSKFQKFEFSNETPQELQVFRPERPNLASSCAGVSGRDKKHWTFVQKEGRGGWVKKTKRGRRDPPRIGRGWWPGRS